MQQSGDEKRQGGGHLRSLIERARIEKAKLKEDEEQLYRDHHKQVNWSFSVQSL